MARSRFLPSPLPSTAFDVTTMGIDVGQFDGHHHTPFICTICLDVAEDPVETDCQHIFCAKCLDRVWSLNENGSCPVCRAPLVEDDDVDKLRGPLKQCYDLLRVKCGKVGCEQVSSLSDYKNHELNCPKGRCDKCEGNFEPGQESHDCLEYWKNAVYELDEENAELRSRLKSHGCC